MIVPSPLFPLAWQAEVGQNTCEASICSVGVFIRTDYRSMLFSPTLEDFRPPVNGVLPVEKCRAYLQHNAHLMLLRLMPHIHLLLSKLHY